jgi:predicted choloylglycine hydrolase
MYHPRLSGNHYAMGQKMGNIFKRNNVQFPIRLDAFQKDFGRKSGALLKQHFPEAAAEIKGITDVTGYDNELFTSWMMCMGCCLYEDENPSEVRGCTAFGFEHHGQLYYGRDNDLPPVLKKTSNSAYYQPEQKNRFILNTSSFINGEEGINQHGLVVAMTFVLPKLDEIKPGFNSVFLVRYILENSNTVADGIETLQKLPIASSCNIFLMDKNGEMMVVECNPLAMHIRCPEKNRRGERFIVTVNHFSSEEMWQHDASDRNAYFSEARYQTAHRALMDIEDDDGVDYAMEILSGRYGFICQYEKSLNFETIWSSVFDIQKNKVYRAEGNPQKTKYVEDRRLIL